MSQSPSPPSQSPSQLSKGTRLGKFTVIRQLGKGGMGEVYLCSSDSGEAAVKIIAENLLADQESVQRFFSEGKALEKIQHPNVVRLMEWGKFESGELLGRPFIAMEFIDGVSAHRLARSNRLTLSDVLRISIDVAEGLTAIHNQGIIHRDIKPANSMIGIDGTARLLDLGIAKPSLFSADQPSIETQTGMIIGTINYVAPELLAGQPATVQSDIYALGLFVWELLNGTTPFKSDSVPETIRRVTSENLSWNQTVLDLSPPGLVRFLNSMLSKTPNKRPMSGKVVAESLRGFLKQLAPEPCLELRSDLGRELSWPKPVIRRLGAIRALESEWPYVLRLLETDLRKNPLPSAQDFAEIERRLDIELHGFRQSVERIRKDRLTALQADSEPNRQPMSQPMPPVETSSKPPSQKSLPLFAIAVATMLLTLIAVSVRRGPDSPIGSALALFEDTSPTLDQSQNAQSEARAVASLSSPGGQTQPQIVKPPATSGLNDHPKLEVGSQLRYEIETDSAAISRPLFTTVDLTVEDSNDKHIVYRSQDGFLFQVPVLLFLGDFFTDSSFADDLGNTHFEGSTEGLYPPRIGKEIAFSIVHNENRSRESIQCVTSDLIEESNSQNLKMHLECSRKLIEISVSGAPVLRKRHKETYLFDANRGVVLSLFSTIESLDEQGLVIGEIKKKRILKSREDR